MKPDASYLSDFVAHKLGAPKVKIELKIYGGQESTFGNQQYAPNNRSNLSQGRST